MACIANVAWIAGLFVDFLSWYIAWLLFSPGVLAKFEFPAQTSIKFLLKCI